MAIRMDRVWTCSSIYQMLSSRIKYWLPKQHFHVQSKSLDHLCKLKTQPQLGTYIYATLCSLQISAIHFPLKNVLINLQHKSVSLFVRYTLWQLLSPKNNGLKYQHISVKCMACFVFCP